MTWGMGGAVEVVLSVKVIVRAIRPGERPTSEQAIAIAKDFVLHGDGMDFTPGALVSGPEVLFATTPSERKGKKR